MKMYAIITDNNTKECSVGEGTNVDFYKSAGMVEMEVEQAYNGFWYVKGYAPQKILTKEEVQSIRAGLYVQYKDPITCQIQSLRDEEQTPEVIADIERLKAERAEIVAKIKEENPYPEETI